MMVFEYYVPPAAMVQTFLWFAASTKMAPTIKKKKIKSIITITIIIIIITKEKEIIEENNIYNFKEY